MRRLFPALLLAFAVTSLLVLWFGDSGLFAYRSLEAYRALLRSNVDNLAAIDGRLDAELAELRDGSAARTEVLSREVGLFRDGDRVVRVEGGPNRDEFQGVGQLVRPPRHGAPRDPVLKGVGLGLAFSLCVLSLVARRVLRERRQGDPQRRRP